MAEAVALTGRQLQHAVIDLARRTGWKVAHTPPVQTERGWRTAVAADGKGFPDLLLVRERVIVAEIKGSDRVSPEQRAWLDAFRLAGVPAYVWTPEEWASGAVEGILRARSQSPFPDPPHGRDRLSDPKPPRRVRDPELLRELHVRWRGTCVLDELGGCVNTYSLHHIHRHPRDDVRANLVMLCGDGTTGHHGLITAEDEQARMLLGLYIVTRRLDTLTYLTEKLGGDEPATEWLRTSLLAPI